MDVDAGGGGRLLAVGLHERRAPVMGEIGLLRVEDPGERPVAAGLRERAEEVRADRSLPVVGHDEHVVPRVLAQHEVPDAPRARAVGPGPGLAIEPHHLLMMRDDARLLGRRPRARDDDSGRVRAARAQRRNEPVAGGIPPDDAAHRRAAAERRDVTHYVARAARPGVLVGHLDDGHRRLGRDAPHGAPDELVEHQVADDERTDASELPDEVDEPSRADAFHGSPR